MYYTYFMNLDSTSFLTSSEDSTVKLWMNGKVVDTIPIPANSIWSVTTAPNGDIVTGSRYSIFFLF